jgi:transposase InsO family protein
MRDDSRMTKRLKLSPKDAAEAIAIFRAQVIGPLVCREYHRGELGPALAELAKQKQVTPWGSVRRVSATTLERWYYAYKHGGLAALRPAHRRRGFALALSAEQRELLVAVRRENRSASVPLILRTLIADGRLDAGAVSGPTVRRLYAEHGLDRVSLRSDVTGARLRWQAEAPNALWHADVCHGPALRIGGVVTPLRIHAILDDASRYIVGIAARKTEREAEMLDLVVQAVRLRGKPDALYLDNGPTYIGEALSVACARLDITLLHARPYDPQARGKMERFWRTLREGCLDHLGEVASHHDVQARLLAFLSQHYHKVPHASLLGRAPIDVYETERLANEVTQAQLRDALTVRGRRRVRNDGTIPVAGVDFELDAGYLAGRVVTVARSLVDPTEAPWIEHESKRLALHPVDPRKNARIKRSRKTAPRGIDAVPFDPPGALLDRALGRKPKHTKDRS